MFIYPQMELKKQRSTSSDFFRGLQLRLLSFTKQMETKDKRVDSNLPPIEALGRLLYRFNP